MATTTSRFQPSGMSLDDATRVNELLQGRLTALIDLELTLKHIHWNVVGPAFIGVHQMIDPQVDAVRLMVDSVAERIATLGGTTIGTPGFVAGPRVGGLLHPPGHDEDARGHVSHIHGPRPMTSRPPALGVFVTT